MKSPVGRYLTAQIRSDLRRKMVFVGGPRQVGKTTLARTLLGKGVRGYLNWDVAEHRERILKQELPPVRFLVFDEIHKYRKWRNYLKGLYDASPGDRRILVTGSARLDLYRRGGDSLQGRYHYLRLHPFSVAELGLAAPKDLAQLARLSGFPEPFLAGSRTEARRWSREYRTRLVHEDVVTLENVQDLGTLELLMLRLPQLVGSPLSINALREDLQVSHKAVSHWVTILEHLYAIFRLSPFGAPRIRAVKKAQKHYHFDWSLVGDEGPRFENLVASHLLKWVHHRQDTEGREVELRYFRDVDGREVDFVLLEDGKPRSFIECKVSDAPASRALRYLLERFPDCDAWQISLKGKKDFETPEGIRVCPALDYLRRLV
jgi:predicted AAA+ superfamily ATPase